VTGGRDIRPTVECFQLAAAAAAAAYGNDDDDGGGSRCHGRRREHAPACVKNITTEMPISL